MSPTWGQFSEKPIVIITYSPILVNSEQVKWDVPLSEMWNISLVIYTLECIYSVDQSQFQMSSYTMTFNVLISSLTTVLYRSSNHWEYMHMLKMKITTLNMIWLHRMTEFGTWYSYLNMTILICLAKIS